jgi:hypothetical protein
LPKQSIVCPPNVGVSIELVKYIFLLVSLPKVILSEAIVLGLLSNSLAACSNIRPGIKKVC